MVELNLYEDLYGCKVDKLSEAIEMEKMLGFCST